MKIENNQKGSTMVEMVMVMALFVLFGVTIYTLIYSGAQTQERIMNYKDAQTDARIALSYIDVRLRQNDSKGKVMVEKLDLTGDNAIVIKERTLEYEYDTWIFCYNGMLLECLVNPDKQPTEAESFHILDTEGFNIEFKSDNGSITNTVYYYYGDVLKSISSTVNMRSY